MSTPIIGSDTDNASGVFPYMKYCFKCRSDEPIVSALDDIRICPSCDTIQDFYLPSCPLCPSSTKVGSWTVKGLPGTLIGRDYICHEHKDVLLPTPKIVIYLDSEEEPLATVDAGSYFASYSVGEVLKNVISDLKETPGAPDLPYSFVGCFDDIRAVGRQKNVARNEGLFYKECLKYSSMAFFIIAASEFSAQEDVPMFEPAEGAFSEQDTEFQLQSGVPLSELKRWFASNGYTGNQILEAGVLGPQQAKDNLSGLVVVLPLNLFDPIMNAGYPQHLVCPYVLRKDYFALILQCAPFQHVLIYNMLCDSLSKETSEKYVARIIHYQCSAPPTSEVVYQPAPKKATPLARQEIEVEESEEEDAEGAFGEEGEEQQKTLHPKKRRREPTSRNTILDVRTIGFTDVTAKKIVRSLHNVPYFDVAPFACPSPNASGDCFVCVPLTGEMIEMLCSTLRNMTTRRCFLTWHLLFVNCGPSQPKLVQMTTALKHYYGSESFSHYLSAAVKRGEIPPMQVIPPPPLEEFLVEDPFNLSFEDASPSFSLIV